MSTPGGFGQCKLCNVTARFVAMHRVGTPGVGGGISFICESCHDSEHVIPELRARIVELEAERASAREYQAGIDSVVELLRDERDALKDEIRGVINPSTMERLEEPSAENARLRELLLKARDETNPHTRLEIDAAMHGEDQK